jgi:hypothetical protein
MFNSVIAHGQASLKAVFLVSGGAAAALLAFLAHLVTEHADALYIHTAVAGIRTFGMALIAATLAQAGTYLSQIAYSQVSYTGEGWRWRWLGHGIRVLVIAAGLCSLWLVADGLLGTAARFEQYGVGAPGTPIVSPQTASC